MVELSKKVTGKLDKTTPGIQIWRIEVGPMDTGGSAQPGFEFRTPAGCSVHMSLLPTEHGDGASAH